MLDAPIRAASAPEAKPFDPAIARRVLAARASAPQRPVLETKHGQAYDHLDFGCELKFVDGGDGQAGTIDGYASVFNIMDRGGDIVLPGAFKATLADWRKRKAQPPMLWYHDPSCPIGVWTELEEDEKGLRVKGEFIADIPQAAIVRAAMRAGAVKGLSIGYRSLDDEIDRTTGARRLKKVDLWEISPVTFPMLPEAQASAKGDFDPRALERALRADLNLSSADAVKAVAIVKQHLRDGGGQAEPAPRDGKADLLMSLRKASASLR